MRSLTSMLLALGLGVSIGAAATHQRVAPELFTGKEKTEAARALLQEATRQAGRGSWERIAVGRVYYLGGMKTEGQAIFDAVLGGRPESSDVIRIARVYREAGEWPRAKELFDRYVKENPRDESELAEIGAWYLLAGDRETAESLFAQSFKIDEDVWATVAAAGAYLGVVPQP